MRVRWLFGGLGHVFFEEAEHVAWRVVVAYSVEAAVVRSCHSESDFLARLPHKLYELLNEIKYFEIKKYFVRSNFELWLRIGLDKTK
jgi:hypothetical protein